MEPFLVVSVSWDVNKKQEKEVLEMKRKAVFTLLMAAVMVFSTVTMFALDYAVPEGARSVTSRFFFTGPEGLRDEFSMVSENGELIIHITNNTLIYFEDFVPLSDDCDGLTRMARDVLFGRSLQELLEGRNLRVLYTESDVIEPISIMILFEIPVTGPALISPEDANIITNGGYMGIMTLPGSVDLGFTPIPTDEDLTGIVPLPGEVDIFPEPVRYPLPLNGEVVVNNVILENAPFPIWHETDQAGTVMVPLRSVAEALGYNVSWNEQLRSVQLGVAIHLWIDSTEVHHGRMAPIEISTAPVIIDDRTFVPLDFFHLVLGQSVYVFEGQVVIAANSDMR